MLKAGLWGGGKDLVFQKKCEGTLGILQVGVLIFCKECFISSALSSSKGSLKVSEICLNSWFPFHE